MKNTIIKTVGFTAILLASNTAFAAGSLQHLSEASVNSAQAIGHSSVAGVKIISGIAAIPLTVAGEIGHVSGEAGEILWDEANKPIGEPLEITDEVITAGPSPKDVIQSQDKDR